MIQIRKQKSTKTILYCILQLSLLYLNYGEKQDKCKTSIIKHFLDLGHLGSKFYRLCLAFKRDACPHNSRLDLSTKLFLFISPHPLPFLPKENALIYLPTGLPHPASEAISQECLGYSEMSVNTFMLLDNQYIYDMPTLHRNLQSNNQILLDQIMLPTSFIPGTELSTVIQQSGEKHLSWSHLGPQLTRFCLIN